MNREHSGHGHFLTKLYVKCPFPAYIVLFFASEGASECMCPPTLLMLPTSLDRAVE